jgi:hypothetical protein
MIRDILRHIKFNFDFADGPLRSQSFPGLLNKSWAAGDSTLNTRSKHTKLGVRWYLRSALLTPSRSKFQVPICRCAGYTRSQSIGQGPLSRNSARRFWNLSGNCNLTISCWVADNLAYLSCSVSLCYSAGYFTNVLAYFGAITRLHFPGRATSTSLIPILVFYLINKMKSGKTIVHMETVIKTGISWKFKLMLPL